MRESKEISAKSDKSTTKKKLIIWICIILAVIVVMFLAATVLEYVSDKLSEDKEQYNFDFYEADYDENIFEDEDYVELARGGEIMFCNMDNVTFGMLPEEASSYGDEVAFMVKYIEYMINGNVKGYNDCYSDLYYTVEKPKENFTMQKIYDVYLTKYSHDTDPGYDRYVFTLSYQILENNGTLRDDFLTGSKMQYILVTNREGEYKIDGISTINTIVNNK